MESEDVSDDTPQAGQTPAKDSPGIGVLKSFPRHIIEEVRREIELHDIPWTENYTEYQSSGWLTASLLNGSRQAIDTTIADSDGKPTDLLLRLPRTARFLSALNLRIFWARLALLLPNSYLWEHVDYTEFSDRGRLRLHIPLRTNPGAAIVFKDFSVCMSEGSLWLLDPRGIHGAVNRGYTPRLHILIDCHIDHELSHLLKSAHLPENCVEELKAPKESLLDERVNTAILMLRSGFAQEAERILLSLFHDHSLPIGYTLDLVKEVYKRAGFSAKAHLWSERRQRFVGGIRH